MNKSITHSLQELQLFLEKKDFLRSYQFRNHACEQAYWLQCSLARNWVNVSARFKHKALTENISESTMNISLRFLFAQSSNSWGCKRSFRWTLWKYCVRQAIEVGHYPNKGQLWGESWAQAWIFGNVTLWGPYHESKSRSMFFMAPCMTKTPGMETTTIISNNIRHQNASQL